MKFFKKLFSIFRLTGNSKAALSEKVIVLETKTFLLEAMLKEQALILSQVAKVQAEMTNEFSYILQIIQESAASTLSEPSQVFTLAPEDDDFIN